MADREMVDQLTAETGLRRENVRKRLNRGDTPDAIRKWGEISDRINRESAQDLLAAMRQHLEQELISYGEWLELEDPEGSAEDYLSEMG